MLRLLQLFFSLQICRLKNLELNIINSLVFYYVANEDITTIATLIDHST